jgi:hypothetical protein
MLPALGVPCGVKAVQSMAQWDRFYGDAVKTGQQTGHCSSAIVHNHYKALVLKTEAEKFWNLRPKSQEAGKNPVAKKLSDEVPGMAPSPPGCHEIIKPCGGGK